MTLCYLALGSNLGSPERQLRLAVEHLRHLPRSRLIKIAKLYQSVAWGRKVQPAFCNTVIILETTLSPEYLLFLCKKIEKKHGRWHRVKWGARILDIDILLYGTRKLKKPTLTIPHPYMLQRDFVLIPLFDVTTQVQLPGGRFVSLEDCRGYCQTVT